MGSSREKFNIKVAIAMSSVTTVQKDRDFEIYILHMGSEID